jgi:hypothetical protein
MLPGSEPWRNDGAGRTITELQRLEDSLRDDL